MTRPIALAVPRKRGLGAPSALDFRAGGETAEYGRRRLWLRARARDASLSWG